MRRILIAHKLKLLASRKVLAAYEPYRRLVLEESTYDIQMRKMNGRDLASRARDALIEAMASDLQNCLATKLPSTPQAKSGQDPQ